MYITLEVWYEPLGFSVYRPLAVLTVTVGEVMKMEQVLHLSVLHEYPRERYRTYQDVSKIRWMLKN